LAGIEVERQKGRSAFGPHLTHKGSQDRALALITAFLEFLEDLLRRIIVLCQQPKDVSLERIEFAGAFGNRGPLVALPPRPLAHRVKAQFKFASNLPQAQLLLDEQVPDLAVSLIVDHG
jgi:hypothetical protein